jgi:hypothetical protein
MLVCSSIGWSVRWLVHPSVGPHITSKTKYVVIASRRGEGKGHQLMSKTGYVEIALPLVTVARSCFFKMATKMMERHEIYDQKWIEFRYFLWRQMSAERVLSLKSFPFPYLSCPSLGTFRVRL